MVQRVGAAVSQSNPEAERIAELCSVFFWGFSFSWFFKYIYQSSQTKRIVAGQLSLEDDFLFCGNLLLERYSYPSGKLEYPSVSNLWTTLTLIVIFPELLNWITPYFPACRIGSPSSDRVSRGPWTSSISWRCRGCQLSRPIPKHKRWRSEPEPPELIYRTWNLKNGRPIL